MDFADLVRSRRMVRRYDPARQVDREVLDGALDFALRGPSAGHTQGWRFLVLDDITSRDRFWAVTAPAPEESAQGSDGWLSGMRTAPVLVVCFAERGAYLDRYAEPDKGWVDRDPARWPIPYWYVDTGMAAMILLLAAHDAGIGACFFGVPGSRWSALRATFAVPAGLDPVGVVSLGYAAADRRSPSLRRGRRPRSETVRYGSFED